MTVEFLFWNRTPSLQGSSILVCRHIFQTPTCERRKECGGLFAGGSTYHREGSVGALLRNRAVMGLPIPSTEGVCLSKKLGGASGGTGSALELISCNKSGRCSLIVAMRLVEVERCLESKTRRRVSAPLLCSIPPARNLNKSDSLLSGQVFF